MSKKYEQYVKMDKNYHPGRKMEMLDILQPGVYIPNYDMETEQVWFAAMDIKSDEVLDLPSPEYSQLVAEMQYFLRPEVKEAFKKHGYLYKRSALLYGAPGTGKTCITNRVARDVVAMGGVVLFSDNPYVLKKAFSVLDSIQPETLTLVLLEECDSIFNDYESEFLTLLDGQVQKENVIYLLTTNYIERINARLLRPGRVNSLINVLYPNSEAREVYLQIKLGDAFETRKDWISLSEGLSIDELKELVQACYLLNADVQATVNRLKNHSQARLVANSAEANNENISDPFLRLAKELKGADWGVSKKRRER